MNAFSRRCLGVFLSILLLAPCAAAAQGGTASPDSPAATTVLTVHGKSGPAFSYAFSEADIMALPQHGFAAVDPWDGKKHEFSGVLLSDLLAKAGIGKTASKITAVAANNYAIPIRRADYEKYGYLVAWKIDGHLFSDDKATKNRGFLSIAVDFTTYPELDPELIKHQLVWQLNKIIVE